MAAPDTTNGRSAGMFQQFFRWEAAGGVVLLFCAVAGLAWANSPWADSYFALSKTYIGISWGDHTFKLSLSHWIADGLMVIFFFVVGLEIKRELIVGELSSFKQAILPVSAAVGGMIVPAMLYAVLTFGGEGAQGWGIPMATDIAFALGILALFGSRAPTSLKVFLTALAIADDLGAITVIALFYTESVSLVALGVAAALLVCIALAGRRGIRSTAVYLVLAVGVWAAVLVSGIHATIAGVLLAMVVPVKAALEPREFLSRSRKRLAELEEAGLTRDSMVSNKEQMHALDDMYLAVEDMRPAGISLEHLLHPIQAFLILPVFALFMAGVPLGGDSTGVLASPVSFGVIAGLVIGKPVGILLSVWLAIKFGRAVLPEDLGWGHLLGASMLAGVGFTMSIFISNLAFPFDEALIGQAKVGVLLASVLAGVIGFVVLNRSLPAPLD
jgi:NhaA family Na+:H+ antiporter